MALAAVMSVMSMQSSVLAAERGDREYLRLMQRYFTPYPRLESIKSEPTPGENVLGEWIALTDDDFQSVIAFHAADENRGDWEILSKRPNQLYMQKRNRELFVMLSNKDGKTRIKYRYLNFDC